MQNANNILFRCSSLGLLMVTPRSKTETISETTKTHLVDVFVSNKYGRKTDISSRAINKGLAIEEDSITLYSLHTGNYHLKNEEHLKNDYIMGTPDLYEGKSITDSTLVIDVKSSWDIYTFFRSKNDKLNQRYYWQLQGYMALTGARKAKLVYCLIDTPVMLINDEKKRLAYKMGIIDEATNKPYVEACNDLDRLMTYDDIPRSERIHIIDIEYCEEDVEKLYKQIENCREWLNKNLFNIT